MIDVNVLRAVRASLASSLFSPIVTSDQCRFKIEADGLAIKAS